MESAICWLLSRSFIVPPRAVWIILRQQVAARFWRPITAPAGINSEWWSTALIGRLRTNVLHGIMHRRYAKDGSVPLPEFNEFGDLPEGRHSATLDDLIARFGSGTAQRAEVTTRLRRIYELAVQTGQLERLVVFGTAAA